jgi:hypothetical protein
MKGDGALAEVVGRHRREWLSGGIIRTQGRDEDVFGFGCGRSSICCGSRVEFERRDSEVRDGVLGCLLRAREQRCEELRNRRHCVCLQECKEYQLKHRRPEPRHSGFVVQLCAKRWFAVGLSSLECERVKVMVWFWRVQERFGTEWVIMLRVQVDTVQIWSCEECSARP